MKGNASVFLPIYGRLLNKIKGYIFRHTLQTEKSYLFIHLNLFLLYVFHKTCAVTKRQVMKIEQQLKPILLHGYCKL